MFENSKCQQCGAPMIGYVEMNLTLTDERKRLCDACATDEILISRALHNDDLLRAGMMEVGDEISE